MAITVLGATLSRDVFSHGDTLDIELTLSLDQAVQDLSVDLFVNQLFEEGESLLVRFKLCRALTLESLEAGEHVLAGSFLVQSNTIDPFEEVMLQERTLDMGLKLSYRDASGSRNLFHALDCMLINRWMLPKIEHFSAFRYAGGLPADDSESLLSSLRLSLAEGASAGKFTLTLDYGQSYDMSASISQALQGIFSSETLIPLSFAAGSAWTLSLTFSDGVESDTATVILPPAFANLHLSGRARGGACFGGFSTSTDEQPKLESHYPCHFYGGVEGVSSYSLGEVETGGRWIDGKPIYRQVWKVNTTAKINTTVASGLDYDVILRMDGCGLVPSQNRRWYALNSFASTSVINRLNAADGSVVLYTVYASECYVIMEYTKRSDVT